MIEPRLDPQDGRNHDRLINFILRLVADGKLHYASRDTQAKPIPRKVVNSLIANRALMAIPMRERNPNASGRLMIMDHVDRNKYKTRVCIEPKPFEPRSHILMGTSAQALCIVNEVDHPNFGLNIDIGHSLIAQENVEDQISLVCRYGRLYHTHFNDNDQQCDADLPPGTVNFIRLVSFMYVLDEYGYEGWYGLDLFPYRDPPRKFIELSRDNLRLAAKVVGRMNERGAGELRASGTNGPELSVLMRDCIREVK